MGAQLVQIKFADICLSELTALLCYLVGRRPRRLRTTVVRSCLIIKRLVMLRLVYVLFSVHSLIASQLEVLFAKFHSKASDNEAISGAPERLGFRNKK